MSDSMSYKRAGVDIDAADAAKREMAASMATADARVLNRPGAFASLFDGRFPGYANPVLVLKTEEPGSKQLLAFRHGRVASICYDMVNHLVNDIAVMGARPLTVQDAVICGKLEPEVVTRIVASLAAACRDVGCVLTGGETSEQPGVLPPGTYVLTSSIVGVVEKTKVIDGSRIAEGDAVLAIASNGLHTNGYTLVRRLIDETPAILEERIGSETFLEAALRAHKCYFREIEGVFDLPGLHGLAHITGGGIEGNLNRILPEGLDARIDRGAIRVPAIFEIVRRYGKVSDADMLRTFNMGVGMAAVVSRDAAEAVTRHLCERDCETYPIGEIVKGDRKVVYTGELRW